MSLEQLTQKEWKKVKKGEEEIGYAWVQPENAWPSKAGLEGLDKAPIDCVPGPKKIFLSEGGLTEEQVNLMLTHLPVDVTFVDGDDRVAYYTASKHRIFPRSPAIIGRKVQKCHPSKSVHIVEKILNEFKSGTKDTAEFWLQLEGKFIHIRYFAVRDFQGNYKGTMEVSQDLTEIKKLEGEKRLLDWE
jgi:DUF438 domain-containing protein